MAPLSPFSYFLRHSQLLTVSSVGQDPNQPLAPLCVDPISTSRNWFWAATTHIGRDIGHQQGSVRLEAPYPAAQFQRKRDKDYRTWREIVLAFRLPFSRGLYVPASLALVNFCLSNLLSFFFFGTTLSTYVLISIVIKLILFITLPFVGKKRQKEQGGASHVR